MAKIHVLVGSVTGKSLASAQAIATVFNEHQHDVVVFDAPSIEQFEGDADVLLIVTSSTGQGDLPPSMASLFHQLQAQKPLITDKQFAVVALGDRGFATFCQAGDTMEAIMIELQGQSLCDRLNIDAIEHFNPVDVSREWALNCLQFL